MITSPVAMFGLSDGGAHCGAICDASMTTSFMTLWARDRTDQTSIPLESVVHQLTQRPAAHFWMARPRPYCPDFLADLNIIDFEGLTCASPRIVTDLPAGGRRLLQSASGYRYTMKRGSVTFVDGVETGKASRQIAPRVPELQLSERTMLTSHSVLHEIMDRALADPSHPAATDLDRELSYAELIDEAARLATGLNGYGVNEGDRVALLIPIQLTSSSRRWPVCGSEPSSFLWPSLTHRRACK